MTPSHIRRLELLLRAGIGLCFIGHGAFGLARKQDWLGYFALIGIEPGAAQVLMLLIGSIDILVGVLAILLPTRALLAWGVFWCTLTAALRPLAGEGVWELVERAGNYGVPLALLVWVGWSPGLAGWFRRIRTTELEPQRAALMLRAASWTTALLLAGHGMLALSGKPLLVTHVAALGLPPGATLLMGAVELALAVLCLVRRSTALFGVIALWKVATELLFLVTGAPVWEFIERGGSYVAPLAAAGALAVLHVRTRQQPAPAVRPQHAGVLLRLPVCAVLLALSALAAGPADAAAQRGPARETVSARELRRFDAELAMELRRGGYVVACRHGITGNTRDRNVDFADPATQRVLSDAGERQMRDAGALIAAADFPFGEILASPYQRTLRSAELMFGRADVDRALSGQGDAARQRRLFRDGAAAGTNRLLMTHQGVLTRQLPIRSGTIAEGDCLMLRPEAGEAILIARIAPADWAH